MSGVARVVLVHGAFEGAWCWDATSAALAALGIESLSIDLPTIGEGVDPSLDFHADAEHVREILDGLDGPIVLCANSYGGVVITEASAGGVERCATHLSRRLHARRAGRSARSVADPLHA
jgi:alpha-beta hydrolase superfamily lysophospholipase